MDKRLDKLKRIEANFAKNSYFGCFNAPIFSYIDHKSHVCLTAPHATNSTVRKHLKGSDWFTGGIVSYLGEENHLSYIIRNKYFYKKYTISSFILKNHLEHHYFLDIHAMKSRPFDLAVGIGYCRPDDYKKELAIIQKLCQKYRLKYVINHPSYTGQPGLTGRLQRKLSQATVLQLEWHPKYRDFNENPTEVLNITIPFIKELALTLNSLHKTTLPYLITTKYTLIQKLKNKINWIKYILTGKL